MLKKRTLIVLCALILVLYGCVPERKAEEPSGEITTAYYAVKPVETIEPDAQNISENTPAATVNTKQNPEQPLPVNPDSYMLENTKISIAGAGETILIYDALDYYENAQAVSLNYLVVDTDALYFVEYGGINEKDELKCSIICTDLNGKNRKVIYSEDKMNGFNGLVGFGGRLFYIEEGFDCMEIGDIAKDGSDQNKLDIAAYAMQNGLSPLCSHAELKTAGEYLYADINFYTIDEEDTQMHHLKIDADLKIERINP